MDEHGPRAILAASNVSDPRLNPALALGVAHACHVPGATLGSAVVVGRQAVQDGPGWNMPGALRRFAPGSLRAAHQGLYNLLGDPSAPLGVA